MLKPTRSTEIILTHASFAIVCSQYNAEYPESMLAAAQETLIAAGGTCEIIRVAGAFEIPIAAAAVIARKTRRPVAVLCLGLIWQGETNHAEHIGEAVTRALMEISVRTGVPCIHEVLTVQTRKQAIKRCQNPETNRGREAALTALSLHQTLEGIRKGTTNPSP